VRVLLDTHVWLWMQSSPDKLSPRSIALVEDPVNDLIFSAASSLEIAVKYAAGILSLPVPAHEYVPDRLRSSGVRSIAVEHAHALHVGTLPAHHLDPFDRLLIAQAQLLDVPILTADQQFAPYDVEVLWAAGPTPSSSPTRPRKGKR
jgi:PIN domain nuclease of toxin-antitoxin system